MAISVGYVTRETFTNLRRNVLMTVAAVLTVAVSLALVGGALLLRQGVNKQAARWRGGVELSVFMNAAATDSQIDAVRQQLTNLPEVNKNDYVDKPAAFKEMKELFASQPEVVATLTENDAPPSFRVVPKRAELVQDVGSKFKDKPGVMSVVYAKETIDVLLKHTNTQKLYFLGLAFVILISATLLILNTVQMAIFSRRREVAVMKLVGATNWFIRIPFMLEGMIQGLGGALVAFLVVFFARNEIMKVVNDPSISAFTKLYATPGEAVMTGVLLLIVGAAVGALGSAVAVRRFLDV